MSEVQTYQGTILVVDCPNCGMEFGVPPRYDERRRDDHKSFYCPSWHSMNYEQESDKERLKRQLDRAKDDAARARASFDQAAASLRATKGVVTKMKKRAAAGVCPCCTRTFQDLARHMKSKHPDFAVPPSARAA